LTLFVIALINHYISFVAMREAGMSQALHLNGIVPIRTV